jgi:hypothetical protein
VLGPLRYLVFAVVGLVLASVLFVALDALVSVSHDASTGFIERWIIRETCARYELHGTVRDTSGAPVPYAVIEVAYLDQRLSTRSAGDGTFSIAAADAICDRAPPARVDLLVIADEYRPKRQVLAFGLDSVEVKLDPREFRP